MTILHVTGVFIVDEPGDGTRYEHIICEQNTDFLFCTTPSGLYSGYSLKKSSIINFMEEFSFLKKTIDKEYQSCVVPQQVFKSPYLHYIQEHCGGNKCNEWTALSIIRSAYAALRAL